MPENTSALDFDWHTEVSADERERIFGGILKIVEKWRLHLPVILVLETARPMGHLAGQSLIFFCPLLATFLPDGIRDVQRLVKLMEDSDNVRLLIDRIAESEAHGTRKR